MHDHRRSGSEDCIFLAFAVGNRGLSIPFLVSGLLAMTLFFTATAVSPGPWSAPSASRRSGLLLSPLTSFTDIARHALMDTHSFPVIADLAALAGFALLFRAVAVTVHARTARRRI